MKANFVNEVFMSNLTDLDPSPGDGDIHVINRAHQFPNEDSAPHTENADKPNFIHSLDLPPSLSASNNLFDEFNTHENQEQNSRPDIPNSTEYNPNMTDIHNNPSDDSEKPLTSALTRFPSNLPPLPPLSESIIAKDIPLPSNPILPEYVSNGVMNSNRPQALLGSIQKKKKEQQGPKTRPAFVMKIWSMVNDNANHEYIRWNEDGESFQVVHREEFMKKILPKYFKHNNFASFVRQLNMYGWHKVQDINSGSLKEERGQEEILQFKNPYFIKGREDLLDNIVRNKAGNQENESLDLSNINFQLIINELDQIKLNQMAIIEDMRRMRSDNQTLWNESFATRERHQKQAQTLDKIMKFLAAVYGNTAGKIFEVENGPLDLNYNNHVSAYTNPPKQNFSSPAQSPQTYSQPAPILKPRLMLMDQAYQKTPTSDSKSPSISTARDSSVEEIIRNNGNFQPAPNDPTTNVNKIYQQIMNHEPSAPSPRHFFPELNSPYPVSPGPQFLRMPTPTQEQHTDTLQGLEQNIYKQGQALLQVQDWIQTLANRQQQQQQQLQQRRSPTMPSQETDLDDFDVNEFLNNNSVNPSTPSQSYNLTNDVAVPDDYQPENHGKRVIEEVQDNKEGRQRKRTRK